MQLPWKSTVVNEHMSRPSVVGFMPFQTLRLLFVLFLLMVRVTLVSVQHFTCEHTSLLDLLDPPWPGRVIKIYPNRKLLRTRAIAFPAFLQNRSRHGGGHPSPMRKIVNIGRRQGQGPGSGLGHTPTPSVTVVGMLMQRGGGDW